jgi:hypothetical protein
LGSATSWIEKGFAPWLRRNHHASGQATQRRAVQTSLLPAVACIPLPEATAASSGSRSRLLAHGERTGRGASSGVLLVRRLLTDREFAPGVAGSRSRPKKREGPKDSSRQRLRHPTKKKVPRERPRVRSMDRWSVAIGVRKSVVRSKTGHLCPNAGCPDPVIPPDLHDECCKKMSTRPRSRKRQQDDGRLSPRQPVHRAIAGESETTQAPSPAKYAPSPLSDLVDEPGHEHNTGGAPCQGSHARTLNS